MVRALSAVILLAASASASSGFIGAAPSASPAIPSFESSVAHILSSAKSGNIGAQIGSLTWDLERYERDTSRLRSELRFLLMRVRRHGLAFAGQPGRPGQRPGQPGRPDTDPSLRWDVQRFSRDVAQLTRDVQWRLGDLRTLSSQAGKDETLVAPASRLLDQTRRLKNEANWFVMDARFAYFDFMRAGFTFEAMDLDRNSRDLDGRAQDLQNEADKLLAKVRP